MGYGLFTLDCVCIGYKKTIHPLLLFTPNKRDQPVNLLHQEVSLVDVQAQLIANKKLKWV